MGCKRKRAGANAAVDDSDEDGGVESVDNVLSREENKRLIAETKHDVLLRDCEQFYGPQEMETLRGILARPTGISLRVFDWLVTNYSKKNNIVYNCVTAEGEEITFNMHLQYKMCLKGYQKRYFDPFRRRNRIMFNGLKTTVGQLNFFKWALTYGVVDYTRKHFDEIETDMLQSTQHRTMGKRTPMTTGRPEVVEVAPVAGQVMQVEEDKSRGKVEEEEDKSRGKADEEKSLGKVEVEKSRGESNPVGPGACDKVAEKLGNPKTPKAKRVKVKGVIRCPVQGQGRAAVRRKQLSEAALKSCTTTHVQVLLKFS